MSNWTPQQSTILSMLLDEVSGTPEMIDIRQDYCRLEDCFRSGGLKNLMYFTGSKAEGLDLPGSDEDYMINFNNMLDIQVQQSLHVRPTSSSRTLLFLDTENSHPCFALLKFINETENQDLLAISWDIDGIHHVSSDLLIQFTLYDSIIDQYPGDAHSRQGPSREYWSEFHDKSESGIDNVPSIHCPFWPNGATEWTSRPRHFDWPTPHDISSIVDFGCHIVPIGHPHSPRKDLEWRISFSIAERTLVWSFNHVQMQCYAVMKVLLKEFIKERCNPQNQVLCSYFIKTFLFWEYESKESTFWRRDNFRDCINYLMTKFFIRLREGVIPHYFFPNFNLLSVKLTAEAQTELLQLFDVILQSDIGIIKECRTLRNIWTKFLTTWNNLENVLLNIERTNVLYKDICMKNVFILFYTIVRVRLIRHTRAEIIDFVNQVDSILCKSELKSLTIKCFISLADIHHRTPLHLSGNKNAYKLQQPVVPSFDVSTCKLMYALIVLSKGDYEACLSTVNNVLSSIPPFALFRGEHNNVANGLYIDRYFGSDTTITKRAKTSWLFDLLFFADDFDILPVALQIEVSFGEIRCGAKISPFTLAYYLMFLCYHEMNQNDSRNRALRQLVDVVKDPHRCCSAVYRSFNIAGHCLLMVGETMQARDMFEASYQYTQGHPPYDKYNSAFHYLEYMFE